MLFILPLKPSNFNSIKVRLEPYIVVLHTLLQLFQFHKGTIRTAPTTTRSAGVDYFNSIKVRLEPMRARLHRADRSFQFHKGTIRTKLNIDIEDFYKRFQFHKGTIRTSDHVSSSRVVDISIP